MLSSLPFAPRPQPALRLSAFALNVHRVLTARQVAKLPLMEEAGISASLFRVHRWEGDVRCRQRGTSSSGRPVSLPATNLLPRVRHGRDRIESGLPLHLGRTRFEAARAEPLTFDVLRTCLHTRPPASTEPACHWDALDTLSKRDCSLHQVHGAAVEAAAWRSSNLLGWSGHAAGVAQHIAAKTGRKVALRLGGLARVIGGSWDEGVCLLSTEPRRRWQRPCSTASVMP